MLAYESVTDWTEMRFSELCIYNVLGKQVAASVARCHVSTLVIHHHSAASATVNKDFGSTGGTTGPVKASAPL